MDNPVFDNIIFFVCLLSFLFLWVLIANKSKLDYVCRVGFQIKQLKQEIEELKLEAQDLRNAVTDAIKEQEELSKMKKQKKTEYFKSVIDF